MKTKVNVVLSIFTLSIVLIFSGCGLEEQAAQKYTLNLEIWGTLDQDAALKDIVEKYKKLNPNITGITYKKISSETYQKELLEALASGQGPDIFMIGNTWVPSFSDKIVAAPLGQTIINEQKFRKNFVDVAVDDLILEKEIFAVPLSVNTLGLYYNKDLFNQAGITEPPKNWNEFIADVIRLTKIDNSGNIVKSGAAIGTAYNINRSTDILSLIMMQNGTNMATEKGTPIFDRPVSKEGKSSFPGEEALNLYTQFGKSGLKNYTWNNNMHYSIDAFAEGQTAMMFNYSWNIKTIQDKAPKLNFAVAPVPQFKDVPKVNMANYQAFAVAKNKIPKSSSYGSATTSSISNETRIKEAWTFLTYLTTAPDGTFVGVAKESGVGKVADPNFDPAKSYLTQSGEPAARRDLIELQKNDPMVGVFAVDNLIAKSWRQIDPSSTEVIFAEMIDQINRGQTTVSEAIKKASRKVQALKK